MLTKPDLCRESDCSQGVAEDRLYCNNRTSSLCLSRNSPPKKCQTNSLDECEVAGCTSKETGGSFCFNHAHVRSQKKGEFDAHAKTERLARVLQTSRAPPDYPGYHYPGHPFASIGSVYAEGSMSSRSARSAKSSKTSKSSHRHHSRHASTSTTARGRKRHSDTSYTSSFDEDDEDTAESTDDSSRSRSRHHRNHGSGGSGSANTNGVPMHSGPPPQTRQPVSGPGAPRPQASQHHPSMPNGGPSAQGGPSGPSGPGGPAGPAGPNGPGPAGPSGGPLRPTPAPARPMGNGAGPAPGGVRNGPPQNTGTYRGGQGVSGSYNDDEAGGQFR